MTEYLCNLDWNSIWINFYVGLFFFLLSIPVAIKIIPYFIVKRINKTNKKFIVRKTASVIQEISEFINSSFFKNKELNSYNLAVFTKKSDLDNYRFVSLINLNVLNKLTILNFQVKFIEYTQKLEIEKAFTLIKDEKSRLVDLRLKLESIINIHSLHLDDNSINEISDLCLDIRSFEIRFEINFAMDDLIESGKTKRIGVFGFNELIKIYEKLFNLLNILIKEKYFDIEIRPSN